MDWRDRRIFIALGLAAAAGLVFGMLLGVFGGGNGGGPTGAVERTETPSQPAGSGEPEPTEASTPSSTSTEYPDDDFGYLTGVKDEGGGQTVLVFDRATLLRGEAAREEAERHGQEANNDFFITNESRRLRDRVVAADATATGSQILTGQPQSTAVSLQQVYDFVRAHPGQLAVYLHYDEANEVVKIDEVYFP